MWFVENVVIQRLRDDGSSVGPATYFTCGQWIYGSPGSAKNFALLRKDPHPTPLALHFVEVHTGTSKGAGASCDVLMAVEYLKKVCLLPANIHTLASC
jgi:hypothetical protein